MADHIGPTLAILLLILFAALATACETAVEAVSESNLRRRAEEGDDHAARLTALLEAPGAFLRGLRLGQIAAVFAGAILGWSLSGALVSPPDSASAGSVTAGLPQRIVMTVVLVLIFYLVSWLLPRRLAMAKPEGVLRRLYPLLLPVATVLRPVTGSLAWLIKVLLRLVNIDPDADGDDVSEDEIMALVEDGEEAGAIESGEKELIENIFEFNDLTAGDVMIHRTEIVLIQTTDPEEEILDTIRESGLSRFPVYEEDADDIIGILSTRDYLLNLHKDAPVDIKTLLRPAYFVPESVKADVLFRDMQSKAIHMAIVVDEYGGTSGLVTMEDLLEELVGNIYDEFDPKEEQEIIQVGENLWRIAGSAELEDVADALNVELPEEELYDTLGGLVFSQLSVIPENGAHLEVDVYGLHIKVEELADRRVEWALVSLRNPPKEEK